MMQQQTQNDDDGNVADARNCMPTTLLQCTSPPLRH